MEEFKVTAIEDVLTAFGSGLIKKARANLNKKPGRAGGTLFNEMSYDIEKTDTNVKFKMNFGNAEDYWDFVDQGVRGKGGYKGRGNLRGVGSPYRFGTRTGKKNGLRKAIREWVYKKNIIGRARKGWKSNKGAGRFITKKSLVFLISRAIYLRGLERSLFITKPFNEMIKNLQHNIELAAKEDVGKSEDEYLKTQNLKIKISI